MANRMMHGRVVVISDNDADTISDCLDGIAAQCSADMEVVVVDRDSSDDSADRAIRHGLPDRVVVAPAGSLQAAVRAGVRDAPRLVTFVAADTRPEPGWVAAALGGLDRAPLVFGPDKRCGNVALDLCQLGHVDLFPADDDVDEVVRRAELAGMRSLVVDGMRVGPASVAPAATGALPVTDPPAPDRPRYLGPIAVVLCTRDRPVPLGRCLQSLAALDDDDHEIIVVDNHRAPTVDATGLPARARLVHEPRRGLDFARNRGIEETTAGIVAYIDDDCEADPHWLTAVRVAFADPVVGLVTGRVRPATLVGPTHRAFEAHFSFDRGPLGRRFTPWDDRSWYPLWTGPIGTGCNMAFRRDVLVDLGGFDELLDVGSTIGGGGDLDIYARLLDRGVIAEYSPGALVWHHHRDTVKDLRRQFRGYGEATGAVLMKAALERPGLRLAAIRFFGSRFASRLRLARDSRAGASVVPVSLVMNTLLGQMTGPLLYLRARRAARRR